MRSEFAPKRILFVFAWLVVGGEETEVRLLAQNLDRRRYTLEVVPCFRKPNMPEQTHSQLEALGEGMPHVIGEAGAAGLPVVATCDNGTAEQITHGQTGLFVSHAAPTEAAAALTLLIHDPVLRQCLGHNLRRKVELEYSTAIVTARWQALFDELLQEASWALPLAPVPGVLVSA